MLSQSCPRTCARTVGQRVRRHVGRHVGRHVRVGVAVVVGVGVLNVNPLVGMQMSVVVLNRNERLHDLCY